MYMFGIQKLCTLKPQLCKTHFICAAFLVLHQNITHFVTPKEKRNILRGQYNYNFPLYVLWKSSIIIHSVLQSQYQIRVFYGSLICGKNINIHSCTLLSSRNKCTGLKFLKKKISTLPLECTDASST